MNTLNSIARTLLVSLALLTTQTSLATEPLHNDDLLVLSASQLDNGHHRLSEALAAAVPGFTSPLFANRGASAHARVVLDRGLSPDQLLVLVNGERRYKSAIAHVTDTPAQSALAVDLDAIPLAAIERVEISRSAGNVQHGSAGAAGVINIILKQQRSGGDLYADFGQHSTEVRGVSDVAGVDVAPGIIGLTTAGDRNPDDGDGDTLRVGGSWGFAVGETGSFTAAASYLDRKRTSREGYSRGQLYPLVAGEFDQREGTLERLLQKFGDSDTQELNFSIGLEQQVHGMTFNMFATYAARTAKSFAAYQRPNSVPISLAAYPEGFLPEQTSDSDGLAVTFQLSGNHFGWDWLATYHQGEDELDWNLQDSINLSVADAGNADTNTEFLIGNNESRIQELSLKINRGLQLPFAEQNRLQLGFDYQLGDHEIERGDQSSFLAFPPLASVITALPAGGSEQVPGIRPDNEFDNGRVSYAVFGELQSGWRNDTLSTRIGARYTDYDDIGGEFDASVAAAWRPNAKTKVNLSLARGHRAPDIGQQFYNGSFVRYFDQTLERVAVAGTDQAGLDNFGGGAIDAETSHSANLTAQYQLSDALRLRAALAWVDIQDRVLLSDALQGAAIDAFLNTELFDARAQRLAFYTNGADTQTTSLDLGATYRLTLSGSVIDFDLDANFYDTSAKSSNQAVGRRVLERLEEGGPGTKVHFRTLWQRQRTGFEFGATWYGSATHPGDTAADDHSTGSGVLLDLKLSYDFTKQVSATFGGLNLLDAYPNEFAEDSPLTPNGFEMPFSSYSPWGFNGRYVYLAVRANFP